MKPHAALIVVSLIFGVVIGRWSSSAMSERATQKNDASQISDLEEQLKQSDQKLQTLTENRKLADEKINHLETELTALSNVDLAEYLRLQNDEQKFQKANELLGKIFMILFNYILTPNPEHMAFARKASEHSASPGGPEGNLQMGADAYGQSSDELQKYPDNVGKKTPNPKETADSAWAAPEKALNRLKNDGSGKFLDAVKIPDIRSEIKNARPFAPNEPKIAGLQGSFSGTVTFLEKKKDLTDNAYQMELDFQAQIEETKPKGSITVRLYKNGSKFSDGRSTGDLKDVYNTAADSKAILIKTGDNHMFQLYYLEQHDMIIGNYYEQTTPGEFTHVGRVRLTR